MRWYLTQKRLVGCWMEANSDVAPLQTTRLLILHKMLTIYSPSILKSVLVWRKTIVFDEKEVKSGLDVTNSLRRCISRQSIYCRMFSIATTVSQKLGHTLLLCVGCVLQKTIRFISFDMKYLVLYCIQLNIGQKGIAAKLKQMLDTLDVGHGVSHPTWRPHAVKAPLLDFVRAPSHLRTFSKDYPLKKLRSDRSTSITVMR